ncbi:AAA family ATPase [Bradyrhizobium liaoningense]|uniref:AAA family ATPase n=1 Tax=Bradyrhizobium liaoningense TaxID=43992 RepID=UPI001BAC8304|nr:adenylate/guanylate cyclase domain-containing protein [Bradyrhizobium liaoningense]MBR0820425.1 AAA family ATPase [Bradyrhizobium liaoningense]
MSHDVRAWLEDLGLGRFAETFAENGVDLDLLSELSNEDLKDLGIARLADRKRLLKAIAGLAQATHATAIPAPSASEGERRQLTVMFCDLVDSTALSSTLDPEQLRDLLLAYQAACAVVIDRYDGHLAKYLGDGLLVYFGLPRAHEDDAQRAVSAGLDIVEAVALLNRDLFRKVGIQLGVRLGVHTGLVVAGEMGAVGAREEMAIVGETPNVAARLQSLATPNALVISASTQRLVGGLFTYEDIGVHQLKGVARPVQAWRVTGERLTESRFEALHPGGPFPLIGREEEVNFLLRRWEQAKQGDGQVVLLCGEPGIGKSRIAEALVERIADLPHVRLRCQCSAYFTTSALYPFARQLVQAAGFLPTDPPAIKLNKLEQMLAESEQAVPEIASLFAGLLSIPVASHYPRLELTAESLKRRTVTALVDRVLGLATRKPVLIVVEDAHWIDASSADVIAAAMDRVQDSRVLILITYRPDYIPPWSGRPHLTMLMLNRLSRAQAADMVGALAATEALPAEIIQEIVAKTDGVPLFIEELTKAVLEAGLANDEAGCGRAGRLQLSVPMTLQDALVARLDRTAGTKEVAQVAAVLGREFSEALLTAVLPPNRGALTGALDALVQAGLLFRRGSPPQTSYVFKHALVQDAAYGTLLLTSRQQLHAQSADVLEQQFPEIAEAQPELLAHHYAAAGIYDRAIAYWQRSGTRARERSNYVEAEHVLTAAVALVPQLRDEARKRTELDLQMALGAVYRAIRGSGSPQTELTYRRARALCEEVGDADRLLEVIYGQFVGAFNRPKLHDAERYASEFMEIAEHDHNASALKVAEYLIGSTAFLLGDLVRARQHLEDSLRVDGVDRERVNRYSHGQYPTFPLIYLAWTMFALGFPNQGHALAGEAIGVARDRSEFYYAMALSNDCYLHHMSGDCAAVEANIATLVDLAAKRGIVVFHATAHLFEGWTRAIRGAPEDGIDLMREALAKLAATEQKVEHPYKRSILAETCLRAGRWSEAEEQLDEALRLVRTTDERWYEAEVHRLAAELALAKGDKVNAGLEFERARTLATAQSARMWELRAATGLARLWREAGKVSQARTLLAPVLGRFTEGLDTRDFIEAKAIFDGPT